MSQLFNNPGGAVFATTLQAGIVGSSGLINFLGSTSGTISIKPQAVAGTYNFNLPTGAGSSGQPLLSGGGGAAAMTFGTLGLAAGGTNADLSATGGTSRVLKQVSAGAAVTVAQLSAADISDYIGTTSFTPALTFATPGDLSVAYSTQAGSYVKIGNIVIARFDVVTSTFTYTTASGNLTLTGLPVSAAISTRGGTFTWSGVTRANYTDMCGVTSGTTLIFQLSGSGQTNVNVSTTDVASGSSVSLRGTLVYFI